MSPAETTKPVPYSTGFLVVLALAILVLAACAPTPTPTPQVTPTRTPRPSRTPFPTLTPRATYTPAIAFVAAVVTDTLRVREQPSTDARILGRLQKDQTVRLLSRTEDSEWFSIEYPEDSGQLGWIFGKVLQPAGDVTLLTVGFASPKPPPGAIFAVVTGEGGALRMRAGPGTNYEVVARIPDKTRILLNARLGDSSWFQANYPPGSGTTGWVSGEFVALEGSAAAMQIAQAPPTPTPGPTPVPRPTRAPNAPTGGNILITTNRTGADTIYALGENGVVRRQFSQASNGYGARYSPDGERIVLYRTISTAAGTVNHIFVMDFDGSGMTDLSARAGGAFSDTDPDWSPDGTRIVMVRTLRAGAPELWTMNANGSNARLLLKLSGATGVAADYSPLPRWSPDGGRIAFAAVPQTKSPGAPLYPSIFVVSVNGGDARQLTNNDLINTLPVWSPDGSQIAWSAKDLFNRENWEGWVMNASGADQRVFLAPPGGDPFNGIQPVAWRGNRVLAAGWTGNWNVFTADAGGSNLRQVTNELSDEVPTDWLP